MELRLKKTVLGVLLVVICILIIMTKALIKKNNSDYQEYCYEIYQEIKEESFKYAKFEDENIIFYDSEFNVLSEMTYEKYNKKWTIIYIENDDDTMCFWKSGAVDDTEGIMFIKNEDMDRILDGLHQLKRIGGNSYWVTTY